MLLNVGTRDYHHTDIDDFAKALESVFMGKATVLNRMRLACTFYNEDLAKKGHDGDGSCDVSQTISFLRKIQIGRS
jgi:hypothetical protein